MKRRWTITGLTVVGLLTVIAVYAFGFVKQGDLAQYPQCLNCGMSRKSCSHTRMSVEYADGSRGAECSLHCLMATLVAQQGRRTVRVLAADYTDKKLVEAEKCWWVRYDNAAECSGSTVMLAFRSEAAADDFIASYGGQKLSFFDAVRQTCHEIERVCSVERKS